MDNDRRLTGIDGEGAPNATDTSSVPRIYTIWPAAQEDLPAATSGPWHQEPRWLVLDVTDGIAASYIVEGPIAYPEALHRAAEMRAVATEVQEQETSFYKCGNCLHVWKRAKRKTRIYLTPICPRCGSTEQVIDQTRQAEHHRQILRTVQNIK